MGLILKGEEGGFLTGTFLGSIVLKGKREGGGKNVKGRRRGRSEATMSGRKRTLLKVTAGITFALLVCAL